MYQSGRWKGYWEQPQFGRQVMSQLTLSFQAGAVRGSGADVVGLFTFEGSYDDRGGVSLVKKYQGRHSVMYNGIYDGEGTIHGQWMIPPHWQGTFALTPEDRGDGADVPILVIEADPAD